MKNIDSTVAEVLLAELSNLGVEYIFLVPGAQITPLLFRLYSENEIKVPVPIIANHELAAGFMAIGYARASGKMGVAISIGGPAAAYMLGAGVTAKIDDVPVLFITGNIPPESFGLGEFQDASKLGTNDSAIFKEAVGTSMVCDKPDDLQDIIYMIRQCDKELRSIHVQIPVNIQKAVLPFKIQEEISDFKNPILPELDFHQKTRTIFLIGQKALRLIDVNLLQEVVRKYSVAIVTDMKSRGILSETEIECLGYIGFNSDIRALEVFNPQSHLAAEKIFTVGINDKLILQYINADKVEVCKIDPMEFNSWIYKLTTDKIVVNERIAWLEEVNKLDPPQPNSLHIHNKISYSDLISVLKEIMPKDTIYCLEAGQIRRAGSIFITSYFKRSLLQSETLSPMGLGICSSIGAQLAKASNKVVCLTGDGSMRMNGIELATAARYHLPIIFILCDNKSYASVKGPEQAKDLPYINWELYAKSLGIQSYHVNNKMDFSNTLKDTLLNNEPILIWTEVPFLLNDELQKTTKIEYNNWLSAI